MNILIPNKYIFPILCLSAAIESCTTFLFYGILFVVTTDYNPIYLGIFQVLFAFIGGVTSIFASKLVYAIPSIFLIWFGMLLAILTCGILLYNVSLAVIFIIIPIMSIGQAFYWVTLYTDIGTLGKQNTKLYTSIMNISIALGKSIGYLICGIFYSILESISTLWISFGIFFILLLYPIQQYKENINKSLSIDTTILGDPFIDDISLSCKKTKEEYKHIHYIIISYIANFNAFGCLMTLGNFYPQILSSDPVTFTDSTLPELYYGIFMCILFIAQALAFGILGYISVWKYKRLCIHGALGMMLLSYIGILFISQIYLLLLCSILCGFACAFIMQSSLVYSLSFEDEKKRNTYTGYHEAIVLASTAVIPILSGIFQEVLIYNKMIIIVCIFFLTTSIFGIEISYQLLKRYYNNKNLT